jgi:hypothetical protein
MLGRGFHRTQGDFPIPLPEIDRHNVTRRLIDTGHRVSLTWPFQGRIRGMPDPESQDHTPTNEQQSQLERLTDTVKFDCAQLCSLVFRIYGDKDHRTLRAEEIAASIKRFEWAVERANDSGPAAHA